VNKLIEKLIHFSVKKQLAVVPHRLWGLC